jgi:hypothetical protein
MRHFTFSWKKSLGSRFSHLQNNSLYTVLPEEEEGKAPDALPRSSMALLLLRPVRIQPTPQVGAWARRLDAVRVQAASKVGGCLLLAVGVRPHEGVFMTRKSAGEEEHEE